MFQLESSYKPAGDQPKAIDALVRNIKSGNRHQVFLGITGSGKTFSMAHVIQRLQMPALVLAPNKTLAAQLYAEFKELFPKNAVEFFVSYYDYYQPEAYIPSRGLYIEKESQVNDQIDRMRHSATRALFENNDVIIVASVSCIYGIGASEEYEKMTIKIKPNQELVRDQFLMDLVKIQYRRRDVDFHRGTFRVRGDIVDVHPPYEEDKVLRVEFFGNFVESIGYMDPLKPRLIEPVESAVLYPASHYVAGDAAQAAAVKSIRTELEQRVKHYEKKVFLQEAERIKQITQRDLELISEMGFCPGIENYSRHLTRRAEGEPPPTLLEYFPQQFLTFIDESHISVPQLRAMYKGNWMRKKHLIEHGFRLPSAFDNRPLSFDEFEKLVDQVVYVSATPGDYEFQKASKRVEQVIRPTGLLDPKVEVRPIKNQIKDILAEAKKCIAKKERILVTTLTKKSAESLSEYLESLNIKVKYLHSDVHTIERTEIIQNFRQGVFDVLVGINLLREGLDLPEVSLVAITDADKEGFLRSARSLIQTIGRVARHKRGKAILYADTVTPSMDVAIKETARRRKIQHDFNKKHGLRPKSIIKKASANLREVYESTLDDPGAKTKTKTVSEIIKTAGGSSKKMRKQITQLKAKMKKLAKNLEFEKAARLRDQIKHLELEELQTLQPEK